MFQKKQTKDCKQNPKEDIDEKGDDHYSPFNDGGCDLLIEDVRNYIQTIVSKDPKIQYHRLENNIEIDNHDPKKEDKIKSRYNDCDHRNNIYLQDNYIVDKYQIIFHFIEESFDSKVRSVMTLIITKFVQSQYNNIHRPNKKVDLNCINDIK